MTSEMKNMQARIPAEKHSWLKMEAIRQGTTLNALVEKIIDEYRSRSTDEPPGDFCACADPNCDGTDHR